MLRYLPNLIGYARILLTGVSVALLIPRTNTPSHLCLALGAYTLGFALDWLDGCLAKLFRQSSVFGAALDMVIDRLSTCALLAIISCRSCASNHPHGNFIAFSALCAAGLDIASHWAHMHATLSDSGSHKTVGAASCSTLLSLYYKSRIFMGFCCISVELALLSHIALSHELTHALEGYILVVLRFIRSSSACGFVLKQLVNCEQLRVASLRLAALG